MHLQEALCSEVLSDTTSEHFTAVLSLAHKHFFCEIGTCEI